MEFIDKLLSRHDDPKDAIAELLKTNRAALEKFESAYRETVLAGPADTGNLFDVSSRDVSAETRERPLPAEYDEAAATELISRIVAELTAETPVLCIEDGAAPRALPVPGKPSEAVTNDDIRKLPEEIRPQLTGSLMKADIGQMSYNMVLAEYGRFLDAKSQKDRKTHYNLFRQGLDILDLDPVLYEMLGMNRNSMSYWLPAISAAAAKHGFFRIPETRIAKVPMPILQLSRLEYTGLTPATLKIVDDWAMEVFELDINKTYFIKTGIFSSKFDFRNAKVTGEKEVRELGEYLLYIQYQTTQMASPLSHPCIWGAATTNEWVVREFIEDVENNPTIYKGMPLHTEYRVFVDCDAGEVLGITPYWRPDVMLKRFSAGAENSPHDYHDYVIYKAHEETLMKRYEENEDRVLAAMRALLPDVKLDGQWSVDVMQNGDDFWLIDMATADTSALNDCVPAGKLKQAPENWLPSGFTLLDTESRG